jgi:chemotaxis protein CheX
MEATLVNAFRASALTTFKEMFGLAAEPEAPRLLDANEDHGWDITGLVGLAGQCQGVLAIRLTHVLIGKLLEGTGVDVSDDGERRALEGGLVGELTNIIAGRATTAITGVDIEIAPPVVIRGPNHKIGWPAIAPVIQMGFKLPSGGFEVDLCMKL